MKGGVCAILVFLSGLFFPFSGWSQCACEDIAADITIPVQADVSLRFFADKEPVWGLQAGCDTLHIVPNRIDSLSASVLLSDGAESGDLRVKIDSTFIKYLLRFDGGVLSRFALEDGWNSEFFSDSIGRVSGIIHRDGDGHLMSRLDYFYEGDMFDKSVTTVVSDSAGVVRSTVDSYLGGHLMQKDDYTADGKRLRHTEFPPADSLSSSLNARLRLLKAYNYSYLHPEIEVDALDGEDFLFDDEGVYLARVKHPSASSSVIFPLGYGAETIVARLADPVHDPKQFCPDTRLRLVTGERIRSSLNRVGVMPGDRSFGFVRGFIFLALNSNYGQRLDFARTGIHDIHPNEFYLTHSSKEGYVAHNIYNFGNFLWGAAAHGVGVPLFIAKMGSHVNNLYHSRGHLDSPDDQLSISCGYHWNYLTVTY
ncbi:MAG: hypothetical protein J5801_06275 [Bacteroidales bacterium]|nr:hypothetical protein [Bacteroidales bacterium]